VVAFLQVARHTVQAEAQVASIRWDLRLLRFAVLILVQQKSEAAHSLRPLTCKQILSATQSSADAEWQVDGHEIGQVRSECLLAN
jgi:hypothetical protein